jgi:hypothetical protein
MRQRKAVRSGTDEGGRPSGEWSWSGTPRTSHSSLRTLGEASQIPIKLNRQIPESKTALSLEKQSTAECSNRQESSSLATSHSPQTTRISNRELLGLEILQLTENKGQRPILIANFEPNHFVVFQTGHSK